MARWKLTDAQWEALEKLRFSTTDAEVFRNGTVILMTAAGRSKQAIAGDLGCSPATVDNVRKRYRERGLSGLKRRKPPGAKPRATAEYRAALRQAAQTPPQTLGFGFSVWSAARLAAYLERQTGVALTADRVRRILHEVWCATTAGSTRRRRSSSGSRSIATRSRSTGCRHTVRAST